MKNGMHSLFIVSVVLLFIACRKEIVAADAATGVRTWSLAGTAIADSAALQLAVEADGSWDIVWPLKTGAVHFIPDHDPSQVYGQIDNGILGVNGAQLRIDTAGNYLIAVSRAVNGRYGYRLQRLRFP